MSKKQLYCGNNRKDPILNTTHRIGTRYGCLKKGIGVGLNMPVDPSYAGEYEPIQNTKLYCGNKTRVPSGYNGYDTLGGCFRKGVGVGKRQKATSGFISDDDDSPVNKSIGIELIPILLLSIVFLILYLISHYAKPKWLVKKENSKTKIKWGIFVVIWLSFSILGILLYHTVTRIN
jgi:hypothetical protein